MAFIIRRIDGPRISLSEVKGRTLRIGRGTNAHLRSDNAAVALEHAYIEQSGEGFELFDRGSITGTYLNGRPVEAARLTQGDRIEIGNLQAVVQIADPTRPLFLRVESVAEQTAAEASEPEPLVDGAPAITAGPAGSVLKAPKVDYRKAYQLQSRIFSKRNLILLALLISAAAIAMIFIDDREDAFLPGGISVAHAGAVLPTGERLIPDHECTACHEPFGGPTDARCLTCHKQAFHQAGFADLGACNSCHAEHREIPRLAVVQQEACIDCHSELKERFPKARETSQLASFEKDHPQFALVFGEERFAVDDPQAKKRDPNRLKFNHRCHTVGDCNKRPPAPGETRSTAETLNCDSCHVVDTATGRMKPLNYQELCSRCHLLTFDNRFPPVPHRLELGTVAGVIANAYSGNTRLLNQSPEEVMRIFATRPPTAFDIGSATVRNARNVLRVRCIQCHELDASGAKVIPPITSRQWYAGMSNFSHVDHLSESLELQCVDCHRGVTESAVTADVSMPGIKECASCHGSKGMAGKQTLGDCTTCHFYHELTTRFGPGWTARASGITLASSTLPSDAAPLQKGDSETAMGSDTTLNLPIWLLLALIVIALLAFVAGATLVAWLSIRRKKHKAAKAAAPAAAAAGQRVVVPPLKDQPPPAARPAAPPPQPAPRQAPAAPPPVERTVMAAMPEAEGTMMVQWHGQLVVVSGLRAGDRFPVMPDGFYIGRDKTMSEVVVESTQISRRHVWVGMKDGKIVAVDQESTNGTFVNGTRITEVELKAGDEITLASGVSKLRYEP